MNKLILAGCIAGLAVIGALSMAVVKCIGANAALQQQLPELRSSMDRVEAATQRVKAFPQEEPALRQNEELIDRRLPVRGPQEEEEDALAMIERFSQWAHELRLLAVDFDLQPAAPLAPTSKATNNAPAMPSMTERNELEELGVGKSPGAGARTAPAAAPSPSPVQDTSSHAPMGPAASVTQRAIGVRFHGEYRAIAEFLDRVTNLPRLITVESLHITRDDQLIPNLNVAVTFRVYSRSAATPSKPSQGIERDAKKPRAGSG